jgi:hypothetical protein
MDSFLDPFASPVPGGSHSSTAIDASKPTEDDDNVNTSQYLAATPKPQSNVSAFRSSAVSDAATLVSFNSHPRSSVKLAAERAVNINVPQLAHVRPSTYPTASSSHKLSAHGYRFSVDVPINYQSLFRSMTPGRKHGWPRSWLLKTPMLNREIVVNPYHRLDSSVPLFQHNCTTISSASSAKDNDSYAGDIVSITTPHPDDSSDDYFRQTGSSIYSMQVTLFALGFLLFPCWWIGGFYCRPHTSAGSVRSSYSSSDDQKTSSWMTKALAGSLHKARYRKELSYSHLFHLLNRTMAILSAVWMIVTISIIIWYYVGLSNGLWSAWDHETVNGTRLDLRNRQSKMNIAT